MPKVIENLRETILLEAKKQVLENGYSSTTIRSVAKSCHIAIGTMYNYFPSKEVMVASFILEDWIKYYNQMKKDCENTEEPEKVFTIIYNGLKDFSKINERIFKDNQAEASYAQVSPKRHPSLRKQIAQLLEPVCLKAKVPSPFLGEFIAEALLCWTSENKTSDEINKILIQFF